MRARLPNLREQIREVIANVGVVTVSVRHTSYVNTVMRYRYGDRCSILRVLNDNRTVADVGELLQ